MLLASGMQPKGPMVHPSTNRRESRSRWSTSPTGPSVLQPRNAQKLGSNHIYCYDWSVVSVRKCTPPWHDVALLCRGVQHCRCCHNDKRGTVSPVLWVHRIIFCLSGRGATGTAVKSRHSDDAQPQQVSGTCSFCYMHRPVSSKKQ